MIKLFLHGGSENHGCEAIVRSTVKMLERKTILYSSSPAQDFKYALDEVCNVLNDNDESIHKCNLKWFVSRIQTKLTGKIDLEIKYRRKFLLRDIRKSDVYLSIGGDNYCYAGTEILAAINYNIKKSGGKLVLWGCSVEPEILNQKLIADDISLYDLITARESISYEALKKVNSNTILVSDPAFTLIRQDLELPSGWNEDNMIGINVSPLVIESAKNGEVLKKALDELVQYILDNTDYGIALIPHVVWTNNDDRIPLQEIYKKYKKSKRIVMLEDDNCSVMKGYIARCRMFIGARTHATIAAYSTCVPTLVLGYSVKSRGIARDLFGTEEGYVLSVQDIEKTDDLLNHFKWLMYNEDDIRAHLNFIMPDYIKKAYIGKEAIRKLESKEKDK